MFVEGLERHVEENPLKLSNHELELRKIAINEQMKKHPNISPQWVEMLWNFLHRHTEQECIDMVNNDCLKAACEKKNDETIENKNESTRI
jgi:hypothetical protein